LFFLQFSPVPEEKSRLSQAGHDHFLPKAFLFRVLSYYSALYIFDGAL
jgi:hypothetical protein